MASAIATWSGAVPRPNRPAGRWRPFMSRALANRPTAAALLQERLKEVSANSTFDDDPQRVAHGQPSLPLEPCVERLPRIQRHREE